jgi:hypothetical protein
MAWRGFRAPELRLGAGVGIAVVVPVMQRPHRAEPFMASLRETTDRARVYAVAHAEDEPTIAAWLAAEANVLTTWTHSFASKVNHAYRNTGEPWLFLVGDDVKFHPDWADELIRAAEMSGAQVIGSNDLHNPRVLRGEHATHMMISRQYIAERGASWDGPGIVCHEGYGHCFVDDEIVTRARQQDGVFCSAKLAVVEHLHPVWGNGEVDAVYERGASFLAADQALFARRMQEHKL